GSRANTRWVVDAAHYGRAFSQRYLRLFHNDPFLAFLRAAWNARQRVCRRHCAIGHAQSKRQSGKIRSKAVSGCVLPGNKRPSTGPHRTGRSARPAEEKNFARRSLLYLALQLAIEIAERRAV